MGVIQDVDVEAIAEAGPMESLPGAPRGDRPNTAPGRVHAIHVESRGIILSSAERAIVDMVRRLELGLHSRTSPVMARESKCVT